MNTVNRKFRRPGDFTAGTCLSFAVLLATLPIVPAHADIYVWQEAGGAKRVSNHAPAWYSASAPSEVRTQVLVNGHLVDDTGVAQPEREKLQATRARAEAWGQASPPLTPVAKSRPPPPQGEAHAGPTKTAAAATAASDIPAKALEGFKSVLEARKLGESLIEEMDRQNRPR